jgi:hypothetical protein
MVSSPGSRAADVTTADDLPLVRPYTAEWEQRERDELDRRRPQRERRRAAVLAASSQDYVPRTFAA